MQIIDIILTYLSRYLMKGFNIFTLILLAFVQAYQSNPRCHYIPLINISSDDSLTYTIQREWTPTNYTRNSKDPFHYLSVDGFKEYSDPHPFFKQVFGNGNKALSQLIGCQDVKKYSQLPKDFSSRIKQEEFQFAYGKEAFSQAMACTVADGKSLITVRFQVQSLNVTRVSPTYTAVVDVVANKDLDNFLRSFKEIFKTKANQNHTNLTTHRVLASLNIIANFTAGSIIYSLKAKTSPPSGTKWQVVYEAFIVVYPAKQKVLVGKILNGQPGVIQSYHLMQKDQKCEPYQSIEPIQDIL